MVTLSGSADDIWHRKSALVFRADAGVAIGTDHLMRCLALSRAWQAARQSYEREHVTPHIYEHPAEFKLLSVQGQEDYSAHRWTLDTPEDLEFVRSMYARLRNKPEFSWRDVLDLVSREPELIEINRLVTQKALH